MEILIVVGKAVGDIAHIAPEGAALTICGLGAAGWLIGRRVFMPSQTNCPDCIKEYAKRKKVIK